MTEQERQEMLATLEKEAADDLWDFMQEVAEGIKQQEGIKTDDQWPVTGDGSEVKPPAPF